MTIWRLDSNTYEIGCSELFISQKAAEAESERIKAGWHGAKTFITECEDIWGWVDNNLVMYIENLINEHTEHIDVNNWHYLMVSSADLYNSLEDLFGDANFVSDYSILMENISSTDEGDLYALSIAWTVEDELNHVMEFVVI